MLALTRKIKGKGIIIYDRKNPERQPIKIYAVKRTGASHVRLSFESSSDYLIVREEITESDSFTVGEFKGA